MKLANYPTRSTVHAHPLTAKARRGALKTKHRRRFALAGSIAALMATSVAAPSASATVSYRPLSEDVSVLLDDVNHPPSAADDAYSTNEDTVLTVAAPGVLANDSDPDGDPLTATLATEPANGTVTLNADGSFGYTPALDFASADSFTYWATDGRGAISAPATVTITVGADPDDDDDGIPDTQDPDTVAVLVSGLPDGAFANGEHRGPALNRLDTIEEMIAAGDLDGARTELQNLRRKVDGCGDRPDTNDWITDCTAQLRVRALIDDLIAHLGT
jgi:Bacterial Ig domain